MTASAVIEEIKQMPREEQSRVIRFVHELARKRQLTGEELGDLAKQMVEAKDPAEADRLKEEIVRGFYGEAPMDSLVADTWEKLGPAPEADYAKL